ncbi:MAG TPA: amidohydrolase family protein, partial [Candidatus Cloacimonadota bacterium]|nr:amidohydrolase family protein [Candidatus Cloacimonadota bacterium]
GFYANALGLERSRVMNRYQTMLKNGIPVTGSSDWYVTPLDINLSLDALLNHHNPKEALTAHQAVTIYTRNAAWLSRDENRRGAIKPGLDADFSVLNYDLSQAPPLDKRRVLAIYKCGAKVYESQ